MASLEESLVQHKDFEEKLQKFDKWLEEVEATVGTEFSLKADLALKKSQAQRFQHIQHDVADHAAALSGLKEQALELGNKDSHDNNLARKVSLLSGRYQGLTNAVKDILSQCGQQVSQHEEYHQGLQEAQDWLEGSKDQLTSLAKTSGSREQIEKRLADVQLLLASKQQGELKLNMAVGLGEKTMQNTAAEGRSIIQQKLESLRKDWQAFSSSASETKASLENSLLQWGSYQESLDQLTNWLHQTESTLDKDLPLVADLKEKRAQLNKQQAIHQDIVTHQSLLEKVVEKAGQVTSDSDVSDIREHYAELLTKAQDRISHMESVVSDHQQYQEALQSFRIWFSPAQEELRGCAEPCTERAATQTKLKKLQELRSYVTTGKSKVEHLSSLGDQTLLNTSRPGVKHIQLEIKTAHRDRDEFSRDIGKLSADLEVLLGEWKRYEEMEKELTTWLANMESTLKAEVPLVSTVQEKKEQLAKYKSYHDEVMKRKTAIEALSKQATAVMGHQAANVSLGSQVTNITSHFQSLTIISKDLVKKLDQTVTDHEQFEVTLKSTSHWISQLSQEIQRCKSNTTQPLETRIKTLKDLGTTIQDGKSKLKAASDKTEKVLSTTAAHGHKHIIQEVERLRKEYEQLDTSLQELQTSVDSEVHQQQEHAEAVEVFSTWLKDLESKLSADVEVGARLGEKKSQLEKYQALQSEVLQKQSVLDDLKQQAAQLKERGGQESASLGQLERRLTIIITRLEEIITMFVKVTTTHTEYQGKVQEAEKWLMLMSNKAVMQEVEAFQSNIDSIRDTGKQLTSPHIPMADVARAKLKKKVDTLQSSYSSVKTAGQQVQQQLDAAVLKHEQLQESLKAADEWLKEAITAVQGQEPSHASSLEEAQKILAEQKVMLEKTKATESSISALSEDTGDYTDGSTPLQGRLEEVTEQLQHRVTVASDLVTEWEGLEKTKGKLHSFLQEAEKNLTQLKGKPAELSINRAKIQSSQIQELAEEVKSKETFLKALEQKFISLSGDTPDVKDPVISELAEQLDQLCTNTAALQAQREGELKAAEEYQDAREQLSSQLDQYQANLAQLDQDRDSSTPVRLDKAKQSQLQTALEHFSGAQFQTAGTQTWLQTMQGRVAAPVVLKLDVQEAQKQLEQYSGLCKEIDERKDSLASMQTFVEELLPNLGKAERKDLEDKLQSIQQQYTQLEKDAKGRRQALGKGVSERRELLSELEQCQTWLEQTDKKVQTLVEDPVALQPHGVQKQINSCKALQNVVSLYQPNIAEVNYKAQNLLGDLDEDDKVKLDSALEGLQEGNDNLQDQLTTWLVRLESALQDRETFQADLDSCSQWLKQADIATFPEVKLDAALQELETQLDKHQHISKEAGMYDEMLNRLQQQGGAMEAQLNPQDATILREKLVAVEQQFKRRHTCPPPLPALPHPTMASLLDCLCCSNGLRCRHQGSLEYSDGNVPTALSAVSSKAAEKVSKLEGALEARRDHESQLEQCSQDLKSLQSQLDKINTPVPLSSTDAQSLLDKHRELQEKLASLQPGVEDIIKAKEVLQTSGHAVSSEEVARLNKEFQKLGQKLQQRCTQLEEAVTARELYEGGIGEVEESLQHCQEAISNLDQPGTTLGKRVEVGQNLSATVQRSLAALSPLSTRGEEIGAEGTDTDRDTVTTQLAVLKRELQKLQFAVQEKQQECEQRLVEQQDFQGEIDKSLDWLWKTRVEVTRPDPLTLDMQYVQEQLKICQLSQEEVSSQMRMIYALSDKEKSKLEALGEEMPAIMADKLAQVKLESEVELRQKYHEATQSLSAWLEAAEYRLHTGEDGVDFTQAQEELQQHKDFFDDTSMHQAQLTEMQDLAKQMMPMLQKDSMQEVLRSLQGMQSRLTAAEEGAKNKDRTLSKAAEKWEEFQQTLVEVSELEEQTEEKFHAVDTSMSSSLQAAQERLQEHQAVVSTFPSCHVQLSALQDKARQLEGEADYGTKTAISRALGQLNERWASLQRAADEQQVVLNENRAQWQAHQDQVLTISSSLQQLEESLPQDQVETAGLELLRARAQDTKSLGEDLETVDSSLMEAGQAAQAIIGKLDPESDAAQAVSQEVRQLQHRLNSLTQQTLQYRQAVQEELSDREQLQDELGETISWIQGARSELAEVEGLGPSAAEVQGRLDRQAELKKQLTSRLHEVKQLIGQKKEKYKEGDLPPEMSQQIEELTQAEEEVEEELARSSEHLEMAKAVREEFQQDMKDVKSSLVELEKQVSQPIMDINKDKEGHQEMCSALEQLRERLDSLNERAKHLSDDTNDPQEKERLSNIIGPLNEHFSSLEAKSKVKKENLAEAADLLAEFEDAEKQVSEWLEKGEELVRPGITWDSYDEVCQQQQEHKDILEGDESQPHIQIMREKMHQLSQLCNVSLLPRLSDVSDRTGQFKVAANQNLKQLTEATDEAQDFEAAVEQLQAKMEESQAKLASPEFQQLPLKERLAAQETLLKDIEAHRAEMLVLLERKQRLKVQAADMPAYENAQTLQGEVAILHRAAVRQNQAIKEAVNQEVQHEAQVQQLTGAIEEAKKQMEDMPPAGTNVDDIKKRIAQHQALVAQVKSYQDQLDILNAQRQQIAIQGPVLDKDMSIDVLMDRVRSGSTASEDRSSNQSLEPEERGKDSGMSSGASVTSSPMPQVRPQHPWDQARHDMLLGRRLQAYGLPGELVPGSLPSTAASVTSTQSDLTVQELDQSGAEYMSLPVEFRPETPLSTGDPELDQLNKSCRSLQEQVSSREQQLLQALQHQEEYQQAVSEVSAGLDTTQAQLDAVLVGGDDLENQLIDVQFVLAELSQLREGVKKVEERGQQAAQSTQSTDVEGNVQVTTSDLHHRLASLKDQAAAKQKEIEEKLEQQRAHQETLSAYQAEMQALHTWVTSARVQSSIDFITASDKEALDEQLEENKRLQSDLEDHLIRLPELQDRCSDLVEKEPPAQAELMFSQLNNLQRDMADLQEALTNREENISQAAEACEQREKELEEYQSRVEKMQKWIAHSKGAAVGEEGVSISVTAATPDSPSETSPEHLFGVAQGSDDQDTTDTPMEIGSDHEMPADETGVAGAEGGARPTSPGSKRAPPTLPSIPEHHSALMRQKGALDEGSPTYEEKQKALDEELAQHKHLLKSIAKKGERILRQRSSTESDMGSSNGSETDMADLKQRWEELSQEIGERKQQLQLALQQNRPPPQLQRKLSMSQFRPPSFDSPGQGETNMGELKNTLDDLHKCWENMQSEMTDSQSRLEEAMDFQQKYQDALEDVSGWLDNIELKLFTSDWSKDSEAQLAQNESLRKEIGAFQDQVYVMNRACQQLMVEADSRNRQVVQQTLSDLKDRLHTLEGQALQKEQELIEKNSQWKDFQMEINSLYTWITETKSDIMNDDDDTEYTIQDKLAHLQDIEDDISDHEDQVTSILERGREMGDDDPRAPVTMETTMLQSNWDELLRIVNRRKNDLGKAATALQQYEKLLQDYSDFIETAEEKLNTGMLTVTGLEELKLHLEKHSEFFLGLDAQKVLVDSLLQKLDPSTREQYIEQHTGLNHRAANALDRAQSSTDVGQVDEEFERQNEWLQETEEQVPVEDMSEDVVQKLQDRVTLYQIVVTILKDHQPVVQRMLDMGNSVLQSVYCPALETKLSQFEDRWTAAKTKTSQELSKLEQLYNQWRTFDKDSTKLMDWLGGAVDKLNKFAEQEPRGIDKAIDDFTEFRKEADLHQPLKESSTALGHQLILLKSQQAETVQERLKIIETNWTQLMGKIPAIEKQLHRTQMEMLPSRQALAELLLWMDRLEAALQDTHEEDMAAVVELQAVLQKYKGYKIDMSAKQLTVDFINQSVMQSSQGPEDGDFLVKHEAMNTRWEELNNLLQARMDRTEALLSHAKEFEGRLNEVKSWLQEQEAQLKRHQKRSSEVEVQHALAFCQDLDRELKEKNTEVAELVKTAQQQVQGKDNPAAAAIQQDMEAVRQGWTNLQQQVSELQLSLSTLADQWKQYYQVQQTITQHLGSTEYTLGRFKPGFGDLETLKKKAEELKELQEEFMAKEDNLVVHGELAAQLMQESDPVVKDRLQREVDQLKARDTECLKAMENQLIAYDQIVELWQQYQDQYSTAKDWVIVRERTFQDLLKTEQKENRSLREEYEELLSELEQYGSDLVGLGSLCEQLCAHVENPASAHLNSQCKALIQRLDSLKQQVIKKLEVAKTKAADSQRFEGEVESLQKLLQEAEEVLQSDDPNKSADETTVRDRMDQIKTQMLKFNNYSGQLEDLNSLGYRLALGEEEANKLRDLNQRWYNMSTLMSDKYRTMQGIMLDKQNFAQKCETWMLFLAQTEKDLAVDIAGNYEGLLEQQKAYEIFQADLFSRQQILHSIVSDGQRIMAEEVLEDPEEDLQQRLTLLRDQWQNVLRRSDERKQVIDHRIQQWQLYKSLRTKVLPWMVEMKHEIVQYEFTSLSLERVRAMLEDVEASLKKVTAQEPTYNSLVETAVELMQVSDKQVEGALERELTDIQKEWNDISGSLEHKRHQLESLLQSWSDCEDDIEGCLAWLRDIKRLLTQDVPSNHDELQREMHICKEYETAFQMTENKLTNIHGKEQQLAGSISPEDLSLLQERVRFLRKQWDEIHLQTTLRRQKVTDKLNEWSSFSDRYKELSDWLTEMEVKITHNPEVSIEDLLENLQKEYQEEMSNADDRRRVLADMGQQLLKAGNEARATEIEYKLAKMQDRWQHLTDLKCARIKKLKETLTAVQQLENNMNSLRSWLSEIEQVLSHPVVYESCDATEIQRKLQEQQELQKDIEKHSTGVASVLNLCEVLLHDCDACATDAECESIQLATRTLDRRWRNICALSMERRLRIEETWRLWQKFQEDYQRFEHWLQESERTAAYPNSGHVTYTVMKEEAFQRKIHEGLTQLELLNKQYRRLARESRTDTSNKLKGMVHDANHRWDTLSKRVNCILRRLKHALGLREEFETTRESLLVWLTEMDLQLTNMEHFSDCDVAAKIKQMKAFQQEIDLLSSKLEYLDTLGLHLMQKCEGEDAVVIQDELDDFHRFCGEVFNRVYKYHTRLTKLKAEYPDIEMEEIEASGGLETYKLESGIPSERLTPHSGNHIEALHMGTSLDIKGPGTPRANRSSGRGTPASVESLDWDMYGLEKMPSGSADNSLPASHAVENGLHESVREDALQDQANFLSLPSLTTGEARHKHMEQQLLNLSRLLESAHDKLGSTEAMMNCDITMGPDVQDTYHDYVKLLSACQSCIENIRHIQDYLTENPHLSRGATSDQQLAGVLDRWDSMKQAAMQKQTKLKQACQQWNQFQSDLNNIMLWLNEAEALLREQDQVAGDIHSLEIQIKKHRVPAVIFFIKIFVDLPDVPAIFNRRARMAGAQHTEIFVRRCTFDTASAAEFLAALDLRKAIVMSINLCSPQFVQGDSEHAQKLRDRLTLMNHRWEAVCNHAVEWQRALQVALVQCAEVQNTVADLFAWLDEVERRRNRIDPIELDASQATLRKQYRALLRLKQELQDNQPRVAGLKSTADQLLETADSQGSLEIKSNLHIIDNRLRLLLEVISADLKQIEGLVDVSATPEKTVTFKLERSADSSPASSPDVDDDEDRHGFYGAAAAAGILAEMDNTYNEDEDDDRHGFYGAAAAAGMIAETDSGLFGMVTGEGQVELEGADARMLARPGRTSTPISSDKDSSSEVVEDVLDSDSETDEAERQLPHVVQRLLSFKPRVSVLSLTLQTSHPITPISLPATNDTDQLEALSCSGEEDGAYLCVEEEEGVERRPGFLRRVFRKAVPLQILMLLLVGTACLVPLCEEDYNCVVARWGMSLHPVLRYVNGPPPM
ncbi:hypothetical protein Bbelb_433440 [Branchiostoma belcheri]|nr:hypothetical protein Bbelb_433440 [Branchiostoma belcheri]